MSWAVDAASCHRAFQRRCYLWQKALEIALSKHFIFQIIVDNLCSVVDSSP